MSSISWKCWWLTSSRCLNIKIMKLTNCIWTEINVLMIVHFTLRIMHHVCLNIYRPGYNFLTLVYCEHINLLVTANADLTCKCYYMIKKDIYFWLGRFHKSTWIAVHSWTHILCITINGSPVREILSSHLSKFSSSLLYSKPFIGTNLDRPWLEPGISHFQALCANL